MPLYMIVWHWEAVKRSRVRREESSLLWESIPIAIVQASMWRSGRYLTQPCRVSSISRAECRALEHHLREPITRLSPLSPITTMKRVLIDQERLRHPYCGLAYYCRALEQGLRELSAPDIQCFYYGPEKDGCSDTLRWHRWHKRINPTTWGFDLLHVTHQLERYFPHRWGVPRVVTLHDLNYLYEDLSEKKRTKTQRLVEENLTKADAIVCISEFVQKDLEAHRDSLGIKPTTSIHTVHNGVFLPDEARLATLPTEGILPDKPYLLALGVLFDKKQQHLLIEMLPHLAEDLHLVLVYSEAKRCSGWSCSKICTMTSIP